MHKAEEEAYFFKMSKYADRLIEHINNNPKFTIKRRFIMEIVTVLSGLRMCRSVIPELNGLF